MCKQHVNAVVFLTARLLLLNVDLQHRLKKRLLWSSWPPRWQLVCLRQACGTAGFPLGEDLAAPLKQQLEVLSCTCHGSAGDVELVIPPGNPFPSAPCWHSVLWTVLSVTPHIWESALWNSAVGDLALADESGLLGLGNASFLSCRPLTQTRFYFFIKTWGKGPLWGSC